MLFGDFAAKKHTKPLKQKNKLAVPQLACFFSFGYIPTGQ
jgi:hypothetical protein